MFKLYDYFRSSAGFRVRIALNLKNLDYERIPVHLLKEGGEQFKNTYSILNPQMLVPSLQLTNSNEILTQSLAIIEYLDEAHPTPPLLPQDALQRAKVRALALSIACDIHPINNLRVLKYLKHELQISEDKKETWYAHWIKRGFEAIEGLLPHHEGPYCFGTLPTLADICLIPQVYNATRYKVPLTEYPRIAQIYDHCLTMPAFSKALPENQSDAE